MASRSARGAVLITALWLLVFMSVMASALAVSNRLSLRSMAAITGGVQARYLAEGAVQLVYTNLVKNQVSERLLADGEVLELPMPGGKVRLHVSDEDGKVDINGAGAPLLARLLYSLDVETSRADALADAIVDFRDRDDLRHLNGAEDSDYEAAGLEWGAKDEQFSSILELRKVLGMDEALFSALQPHVTVYTRQKGVNPLVASLPVLVAISDDSLFSLQSYVEQRRRNHAEGLPLPNPPSVNRRFLSRSRGTVYKLTAVGETDRGQRSGLTTTVRLRRTGGNATIQTLEWTPYAQGASLENADDKPEEERISRS